LIERLVGGLDIASAMGRTPFASHVQHDAAQFILGWQWQFKLGSIGLQLRRHLQRAADQHHRGFMARIAQRDVLELSHMDGVLQEWMKIQQHEQ
jgi:hypothetical protein